MWTFGDSLDPIMALVNPLQGLLFGSLPVLRASTSLLMLGTRLTLVLPGILPTHQMGPGSYWV